MDAKQAVEALSALAHDHRLTIYRMLVERGPDGLPAGLIAAQLGVPASSLTFHLQHLLRAALVTQRRVSRQLIYAADFTAMNSLVGYLTENCCGRGNVAAPACNPACMPAAAPAAEAATLTGEEIGMKRLHVHVAVDDLTQSVRFYSTLFATQPTVTKPDYAKWVLDDPRVNFAISTRSSESGLDHLGIQVETQGELDEVYGRLRQADRPLLEEGATTCCYAQSEKAWITDPQGVPWETFLTTGESTVYGDSADLGAIRTTAAVCAPKPEPAADAACCAS